MSATDINYLSNFLSQRTLPTLDSKTLQDEFGVDKFDVIAVFGNAIPRTVEFAAELYHKNLCKYILVSGAIGHSTPYLRDTVKKIPRFTNIEVENLSEAEIFFNLLTQSFKIPPDAVIIEKKSLNCGGNASETIKILDEKGISRETLLILQDPTMQLRSYASYVHWNDGKTKNLVSFAPFVPQVDENLKWKDEIEDLWEMNRFIELLLGEIPRLLDNENGYGPNGKKFICHVDIPDDILESYNRLKQAFQNADGRII
ncbi:hypothetical protein TRFO_15530 [Tritrichomonas foetus]|uniref:DUF218 domain-containing protein n=1 Tax=Tritrichomonas foetus TaxID=1144522 RepID=A0A1J4KSF3_9EUKA|nr:hypothetical protein TRFO_15530 [Tritrichomonas foetus]|eukprot:OHT14225.1 hypothetical protein TRFO_15530 [Tritrichomonas foetus]